MSKLTFAGHESFTCKQFWLKKGYDFLEQEISFGSDNAVIELGVGKNMVRSIRYWLDAFNVINDKSSNEASELGEYLFGSNGKDLFLEDIGSIWLLHYFLVSSEKASIYSLVFNEFRKTRSEFHSDQLHSFLKQKCNEYQTNYNENTINRDIKVFIDNYRKPSKKRTLIEDAYSGLLHELNLLYHSSKESVLTKKKTDYYLIPNDLKPQLPYQVVLFAILDNKAYSNTVSLNDLLFGKNSAGRVFALSSEGLIQKIEQITAKYKEITFSETAGNRVLQFSSNIHKWDILNDYYAN